MEKQSQNGMYISVEIQSLMRQYRTGGDSDRPMSYMDVVRGMSMSHQTWYRLEERKMEICSWDVWQEIYTALTAAGLMDPDDPQYMPPDRMRELLRKVDPSRFGQTEAREVSARMAQRDRLKPSQGVSADALDAIMASDMCAECKVKAYTIIKSNS